MSNNKEAIDKVITDKLQEDYNKTKPYIDNLFYYATQHAPVFLVVDNVDQLDEKTQSQIFTDCVAFSKGLK